MSHAHRVAARTALITLALAAAAATPPRARANAARDAEALYQRAQSYEQRGLIETRRLAMDCLERATMLAPERADYQLALGRVYYRMGFLRQARLRFLKVERMDPQNADASFGLGQVWRHDWLKYLERSTLERAIASFRNAARLRPGDSENWLQLVPLLVEQKELTAAGEAAEHARAAAPDRPEAGLAVAYTSFRLGRVARADSLFRRTLPKLPRLAREKFEDIAPVASEQDTVTLHHLPEAEQAEFIRRFWREHDPDLVSPENEAQLEYWARVAQAYFLFFDAKRKEWDLRGEVYVRYGPPERAEYNPIGNGRVQLYSYGGYPMNLLVWSYPSLGMQVQLQDRLLSEYYLLPTSLYDDMDPRPSPEVLARRDDVVDSRGGRGVFPMLPPGVKPRPVEGVIARFSGEKGPMLFGEVESPGAPDDSLWAEWVVLDSSMTEVARASREAGVSVCDPAQLRAADFAAQVKPGRYQVGITIRDRMGRRGVYRASARVGAAPATLTLSDAIVTCGRPDVSITASGGPAVRLEAAPSGEVFGSGPLHVYFEMYDLRPDETGTSRFEYEATVRSADKDPRIWLQRLLQPRAKLPAISASRREEQPGSLRRQFVSIPVGELAEGRYRLDIKVRDLNAGEEAVTQVPFVKRAGTGTGG